jgi:pyruvate,water dikinase
MTEETTNEKGGIMKTSVEVYDRFYEGPVPGSGEDRRETAFSDGYAVAAVMNGRAASAGTAIGRATVVIDRDDIVRVREGAIIISRTASPDLAMAIPKARAMATEKGGLGATASGFARAYEIPAVVGVEDLIKTVKDGDLVRVDGTKGTVEIIKLNAGRRRGEG